MNEKGTDYLGYVLVGGIIGGISLTGGSGLAFLGQLIGGLMVVVGIDGNSLPCRAIAAVCACRP